jgi:DNA-binding CsgD family transcriptional regulator
MRTYTPQKIEKLLSFFNRTCNTGNFCMMDYFHQKIIMGSAENLTITGFSKRVIMTEGLKFYERILSPKELGWLKKMHQQAFEIFYSYPVDQREDLEFTYHLIARTERQHDVVLRHKLVPYKLCKNGNMWLGLCYISTISFLPAVYKARVVNVETGEVYNYINDKFVKSEFSAQITPEEISILDLLSRDTPVKKVSHILNMSESNMKIKRQKLFKKLGVKSWIAALQKAHELNVL